MQDDIMQQKTSIWKLLQANSDRLSAIPTDRTQLVNNRQVHKIKDILIGQAIFLGSIVLFMWMLEVVDLSIARVDLDMFGIQPRTLVGLRNIFFSPFLHVGFGHLLANTIPFIVLGWMVLVRGVRDFVTVSIIAGVVSGLGVWLLGGADTVTLGLSGVVFGYLGYLLARGYYERSLVAIILAVVAVFLYGGMIFGVLPIRSGVSWLGHLFGLVGGVVAAYVLVRSNRARRWQDERVTG
jgi:membrane associated rhomboid family serine protease